MASIALGIMGLVGAGASLGGSLIGANASETAAQEQTQQEQQALQFQEQEYATQQANEAPFLAEGQSSVGQLMAGLQNGTFGPGSIPAFQAPTLAEAQQTPGYEFTKQQGEQGIEAGAAAAGGAFTGGTLKSLDQFDTGLADSTYQQVFSNALTGYQTQLATQNQAFNQLAAGAGVGQAAASSLGSTGAAAANTVGSTLTNIGATQAAGTIGAATALSGGLTGAANASTLPLYLQALQTSSINNPLNIQNSTNAGQTAMSTNGLPTGGGYTPPYVPPPAFPSLDDEDAG